MANLTHLFKADGSTARSTTSTSLVEVTQYTISWSNLTTAGFANADDVIVIVKAQTGGTSASGNTSFQVGKGSTFAGRTQYADSLSRVENASTEGEAMPYFWMDVLTLSTNDNLYFALATTTGTGRVSGFRCQIYKLADLGASNYAYAEQTHSGDGPTTYGTTGAALSIPATGDWLIFAHSQWLIDSTSNDELMAINDDSSDIVEISSENEDNADQYCMGTIVYKASYGSGASPQVRFKVSSATTPSDCVSTKIFGLRLDAFEDHWGTYDEVSNSVTEDVEESFAANASYSKTSTGPFIMIGMCVAATTATPTGFYGNITLDGSEFPAPGDESWETVDNGAAQRVPKMFMGYSASVASGTRSLGYNVAASGGTFNRVINLAVAFSLTLATAARTLTASAGTVVVTGATATPKVTHLVSATAGTVVVTGAAATLKRQRLPLTASAGNIVVTGATASLKEGHLLAATAGTVAVTGEVAQLKYQRLPLAASAGTVVVTGTAAAVTKGSKIVASAGTVVVTGQDATLTKGTGARTIVADAGTVVVTGVTAALKYQRNPLTASVGTVVITGVAATLKYQRLPLTASPGTVVVSGQAATLTQTSSLPATAGTVVVTGTAAALRHQRNPLTAVAGTVIVTGATAPLRYQRLPLTASAGTVVVTGTAATLKHQRLPLTASLGAVVVTGAAATLSYIPSQELAADPGLIVVTGTAATLKVQRLPLTASPGTVVIAGSAAGTLVGHKLVAVAGTVIISGQAATLSAIRLLAASPGAIVVAGSAATLIHNEAPALTTETGSLSLLGGVPEYVLIRKAVIEQTMLWKRGQPGVRRMKMGHMGRRL